MVVVLVLLLKLNATGAAPRSTAAIACAGVWGWVRDALLQWVAVRVMYA